MLELKNINKEKLLEECVNCIDNKPLAAVLLLGNLFYLKDRAASSQLALINDCIDDISAQITPKQFNALFNTAIAIDETHKQLMEKGTCEVLGAFVFHAITDKAFREGIDNENLVLCAKQLQYTLSTLITLIQNHVIKQKEPNPFEGFDYQLLKSASHNQVKEHIAAIVKKCLSLPQAELIKIGEQSEAAAKIINSIIYSHDEHCEIEAKFAEKHPSIRPKVAKQWSKTAATVPQTTAKATNMDKNVTQLAQQYTEFKQVNNTKRVRKDETPANQEKLPNAVPPFTLMGAFFGLAVKPAAGAAAKMCILSASAGPLACLGPTIIPIAICAATGATLGAICNMNEKGKESSTVQVKKRP